MIAALSMCLILVSPAQASWTPVFTLSLSGWQGQDSPTVAVDRQGDSLLVWAACKTSIPGCLFQIQARIKPRRGRMGPVKTLSPLGQPQAWPRVASGDNGDSAVVWQNGSSQVVGRRVSATGSVGRLRTLSASSALAETPTIVANPQGRALVVWPQERNGGWTAVARYFMRDGSLGPLMTLGPAVPDRLGVAIDRLGTAVVAWADPSGRVVARRVKPGHVSRLRVIMPAASGIGYGTPVVGDDRDGDAVLCFLRSVNSGNGGPTRLWARRWSRTGRLGSVLHLSSGTLSVTFYRAVATDFAGDSMVVWSQYVNSAQTAVFGRRISRTGSVGPLTRLGLGDQPAVAVDDDGHGLAVWQSLGASDQVTKLYARRLSRTGRFGQRVQVSADGRVARTAASPWGRFSVIWQQSSAPYRIRARFGP